MQVLTFLVILVLIIVFSLFGFITFIKSVSGKMDDFTEKRYAECYNEKGKFNGKCFNHK